MPKTLIFEFELTKQTGTRRDHDLHGIKQMAEENGQYYTRWVPCEGQRVNPPWEPISAVEADATTLAFNALSRSDAHNAPEHTAGREQGTGVNHLEMAVDALRNMSDGDGSDEHLFAIGLALVALAERVDLMVGLAMRSTAIMEEVVANLERLRWATLPPDVREEELRADGRIP